MKLRVKILNLRMRLGLDPWARAARTRYNALQRALERERIRNKAMTFQATVANTDEIVAQPVAEDIDEGAVSVFEMPRRASTPEDNTPYRLDDTGIDVVFDPTDEDTADLMRRFEMGNIEDHERQAVFGNQADNTPPDVVFERDPFDGIKNLG